MVKHFVCLTAAAALLPAPVAAREPARLAPSSKWIVNYAADSCRLARSFGTGEDEVLLVMDRFQPGPMVYLTLVGKPVKVRSENREAVFRFGPGESEQRRSFDVATRENGAPVMLVGGSMLVAGPSETWDATNSDRDEAEDGSPQPRKLPDIDPAWNDRVTSLEIRIPGKQTVLLDTGAMGKPMEALTACTDDLLRGWGVDVEAHRKLSRSLAPAGNPGRWLNFSDYPTKMLQGGYQGIVHFRLIVDEAGKPKSCHIQKSTRPEEFEKAVCAGIMRRAEFTPALDANGKPVASYYINRARFQM